MNVDAKNINKIHFNMFLDYFLKASSNSFSPAMYENGCFPASLSKYICQISFENYLEKLNLIEVESKTVPRIIYCLKNL